MEYPRQLVADKAEAYEPSGDGVSPDSMEGRATLRRPTAIGQIIALIATFNRKDLLCKCLDACLSQTESPDRIFIFDNGSTDGTKEHLEANGYLADPRISYFSTPENLGCAVAYDRLLRLFWQAGGDWVWFLDDDVIPDPDTLAELKAAYAENFSRPEEVGLLASKIVDADGAPNNVPEIDMRPSPEDSSWDEFLGKGLVKIRWSVFCSYLMPRTTLKRFGSVNPDFYSAGVDIEFTLRITAGLPAYLVGKSQVTHLRNIRGTYSILTESDPYRIRTFFRYHHRNVIYLRRKYYSRFSAFLYFGRRGVEMLQALLVKEHRWLRVWSILAGAVSGVFYNPKSESLSMIDLRQTPESLEKPLPSVSL